jgi:hypothetical protein
MTEQAKEKERTPCPNPPRLPECCWSPQTRIVVQGVLKVAEQRMSRALARGRKSGHKLVYHR